MRSSLNCFPPAHQSDRVVWLIMTEHQRWKIKKSRDIFETSSDVPFANKGYTIRRLIFRAAYFKAIKTIACNMKALLRYGDKDDGTFIWCAWTVHANLIEWCAVCVRFVCHFFVFVNFWHERSVDWSRQRPNVAPETPIYRTVRIQIGIKNTKHDCIILQATHRLRDQKLGRTSNYLWKPSPSWRIGNCRRLASRIEWHNDVSQNCNLDSW